MTPREYTAALLKRLPAIVTDELQLMLETLFVYIADHMNIGEHPKFNMDTGRYDRPYVKNATNQLYTNTKTLYDAATSARNRANLSKVKTNGQEVVLTYAINTDLIPYANIHEYGGTTGRANARFTMPARPYVAPAMAEFADEELNDLADRVVRRLGAIA